MLAAWRIHAQTVGFLLRVFVPLRNYFQKGVYKREHFTRNVADHAVTQR